MNGNDTSVWGYLGSAVAVGAQAGFVSFVYAEIATNRNPSWIGDHTVIFGSAIGVVAFAIWVLISLLVITADSFSA